ncbi:MAG TPA: phosphatase PAP2 family protein [Dehalococcoidia bacterium]|nr:phosphatase PAP2 family protein [Dehalococcoidia bacterium]
MDWVTDAAEQVFRYGRWGIVAAFVLALLLRDRERVEPLKFAREVLIVVVAYFAYFLVRGLTEGSEDSALENAGLLIDLERSLGILWEPAWQETIIDSHRLVTFANWAYIWGHWPIIAIVAAWLYLHRRQTYFLYRNAFIISGGIGLVIFALFPVAPPRLTDLDVVDTVTSYSKAYRVLQPPALVNQYAAVPSLHFGWNLLVAIAVASSWRNVLAWSFAVIMPVVMFFAVVLTANHYILDAVAGAVVALAGLLIAWAMRNRMRMPPLRFGRREPPATRLEQARQT